MLELALVENVVRADLSPLEEAHAYRQLIEEFGLTQASVAARVGRSRVSITNTLRLLNAPTEVLEALEQGLVTEGHARALLGLPSAIDQVAMLRQVIEKGLTVRQTEELSRFRADREGQVDPRCACPAQRGRRAAATHVADEGLVRSGEDGAGVLTIHYFTDDQLADLYRRLSGEVDDI
jgi:ParB family chromosome partitioning protein